MQAQARRIKPVKVVYLAEEPEDWVGIPVALQDWEIIPPGMNDNGFEPGWYVRDENSPDVLYIGPYLAKNQKDAKAQTTEAKKGLQDFWKYEH